MDIPTKKDLFEIINTYIAVKNNLIEFPSISKSIAKNECLAYIVHIDNSDGTTDKAHCIDYTKSFVSGYNDYLKLSKESVLSANKHKFLYSDKAYNC